MKKVFLTFFMLNLIVTPFILTSCEKDHGTVKYEDVDDDDWKKRVTNVNDNDIIDLSLTEHDTMDTD